MAGIDISHVPAPCPPDRSWHALLTYSVPRAVGALTEQCEGVKFQLNPKNDRRTRDTGGTLIAAIVGWTGFPEELDAVAFAPQ
jgi:hypothetical protein